MARVGHRPGFDPELNTVRARSRSDGEGTTTLRFGSRLEAVDRFIVFRLVDRDVMLRRPSAAEIADDLPGLLGELSSFFRFITTSSGADETTSR